MNYKKNLLLLISLLFTHLYTNEKTDFIKSFVTHYDFSPEGRYTHEYHPYLLNKTKDSLSQLEQSLSRAGFDMQGRIIIMGYQEEGIPSYYSSLNAQMVNDEVSLKAKKGRIVPAHNIFGFITGFLLKDCNWLQNKWFPSKPLLVEHITPEKIELFNDNAQFFQKHAFGKHFNAIFDKRDRVEKSLQKYSIRKTLETVISFWDKAYKGEFKNSEQEVLTTQDILFSIDYAKHLTKTDIPLTKMYIGPDITYPIEVLSFQEQKATESAQKFVQKLTPTLQKINNKKTAYIFCSFVDGVGKSTLLGNIINWKKHGNDIDKYERVDNSSSQRGTLYSLDEDSYILDLPAQLSHWVSKPDGYVFVDVTTVQDINKATRNKIEQTVQKNHKNYITDFYNIFYDQNYTDSDKDRYIKNVRLFNPTVKWIPFELNGNLFIFNEEDTTKVKILVPIAGVHSKGLKNVNPEQMLFTKGLLLPMHYPSFTDDIIKQLKDAEIESLVFVDFLSMYPRSSRENVRINFLMQQLKKIYPKKFNIKNSLYKSFVNRGTELYHTLKKYKEKFCETLYLETIIRTGFYTIFKDHSKKDIVLLSEDTITDLLKKEVELIEKQHQTKIKNIVNTKVTEEFKALRKYGQDKNYEIFVSFSFNPLLEFSYFMNDLFSGSIDNDYINELWNNAENTKYTKQLASLDYSCRDPLQLSPLLSVIRAHWYGALGNIVYAEELSNGVLFLDYAHYYIIPLSILEENDTIHVAQKSINPLEETPKGVYNTLYTFQNFIRPKNIEWGEILNIPHCLQWDAAQTYWGLYSFGYNPHYGFLHKIVKEYEEISKNNGFENTCMTSSYARNKIAINNKWKSLSTDPYRETKLKKVERNSEQWYAIQLWVRAIATLEMIIKDPQVAIMTRKGNREDFAATLELLERITLPRYFKIELSEPLFDNYNTVQPVISWDIINS